MESKACLTSVGWLKGIAHRMGRGQQERGLGPEEYSRHPGHLRCLRMGVVCGAASHRWRVKGRKGSQVVSGEAES